MEALTCALGILAYLKEQYDTMEDYKKQMLLLYFL